MYAAVRAVEIPRLTRADVAVELQRAVLRQDADGVDTRVGAVRERKVNDAEFAAKRHGGLRHILREHIEPAALPAGKQHGDTFFLHACSLLFVSSRPVTDRTARLSVLFPPAIRPRPRRTPRRAAGWSRAASRACRARGQTRSKALPRCASRPYRRMRVGRS